MSDPSRDMEALEAGIRDFQELPPHVLAAGTRFIEAQFNEARLRELGIALLAREPEGVRWQKEDQWVNRCGEPTHRSWRLWAWMTTDDVPSTFEEACAVAIALASFGVPDREPPGGLPSPLREAPLPRRSNYFLNDAPSRMARSLRRSRSFLQRPSAQGSGWSWLSEAEVGRPADPHLSRIAHAPDFTWLRIDERRYEFKKGQEAGVIARLFDCWRIAGRADGFGMTEEALAEEIGAAPSFRIQRLFEGHPALRTILRSPKKGVWALFLNEPSPP